MCCGKNILLAFLSSLCKLNNKHAKNKKNDFNFKVLETEEEETEEEEAKIQY